MKRGGFFFEESGLLNALAPGGLLLTDWLVWLE